MKIENVILETHVKYHTNDEEAYNHSEPYDILEITVPLPGGKAIYEIPLPDKMKESLEYAVKIANGGK